ncbi:hypothetical protein [Patulibacter americanus]|uniref:hypothetical protein n=1 Tax=Patulibacter americanus TaxID=588672 RepID=UPI0003B752C9|nr:hypothetical protein [Patulibacter americanus]
MTWWVIAVAVWVVASFAAAGVVVLLSRRGRSTTGRPAADRRSATRRSATGRPPAGRSATTQPPSAGLRAPGPGRTVAPGGPVVRHQGTRGRYVTTAAQRHRRR